MSIFQNLRNVDRSKIVPAICYILGVALASYMIYTTMFGIYRTVMIHRAIFLIVAFTIYFLICKPLGKTLFTRIIDLLLIAGVWVSCGYIILYYDRIIHSMAGRYLENWELGMGVLLIAVIFEGVRRTNFAFFIISAIAVLYTLFGQHLTGILQHEGLPLIRVIYFMAFTSEGVFGVGVAVTAGLLFMFLVFGAALQETGTGDFLIKFANSTVGKTRGGAAKASVGASAAIGSIMGVSTGNAAITGALTIPLMIKSGFKRVTAGAIECFASEGGQILPPVMGASAFILAEITRIPYREVIMAALIPALMYFAYGFYMVHLEALNENIKKHEPAEGELTAMQLLKDNGVAFLPIILMFYLLIVVRLTPMYAGMLGLFSVIILTQTLGLIRRRTTLKDVGVTITNTLAYGTRSVAQLTGFIAAIGLVQQAFVITGLGARFAQILVAYFGDFDLLLLFVGMLVCIILGMGLPTPVAYMLCALFVAPALEGIGIPVIAAHLFLLMAAIKAGSTPPIAVVAMVTSNIAEADFWRTALKAFLMSIPAFILAFAYVYRPELLLIGEPVDIALRSLFVMTGLLGVASVFQNYFMRKLHIIERGLAFIISMVSIFADLYIAAFAFALLLALAIFHITRNKRLEAATSVD